MDSTSSDSSSRPPARRFGRRRAAQGLGGLALGALGAGLVARGPNTTAANPQPQQGTPTPPIASDAQEQTTMSNTFAAFTPADSVIVLVDHQPGVLAMSTSVPAEIVTRNTAILAKLGEDMGIPIIITSTRETIEFLGTNLPEIQAAAPIAYAARIARGGSLNAFADPRFGEALAATGRRNLIMAGLLTDVCLFNTAVSAVDAGYNTLLVADASGTSTTIGDAVTYDRLHTIGVQAVTTYGILFELYPDLSTEEGLRAEAIAAGGGR